MIYYMINIGLLLIEGILFQYCASYNKKKRIIYSVLAGTQFILMSGLRHATIGADTQYYLDSFNASGEKTWLELWNNLADGIVNRNVDNRDGGYYIFAKVMHSICKNERVYLLCLAMLILIPIIIFIYKNSRDTCMSYVLFACLFFQVFGITAIRQSIALSLVSVVGYRFVKERKLLPFLLTLILAATFHKTVLIMLPFYFIGNIKLKRICRYICVAIITLAFFLKDILAYVLNILAGYGYGAYDGGGKPVTFTLLMLGVVGFILLRYEELIKNNNDNIYYVNAIILGTILLPLTWINPSFMRLCYYYYIFLVLLIPELVECFNGKMKVVVTIAGYIGMITLFIRAGVDYRFFWG